MQILLLAFMELFGFILTDRASPAAARAPLWAKLVIAGVIVVAALILAVAAMVVVAVLVGGGVGMSKSM